MGKEFDRENVIIKICSLIVDKDTEVLAEVKECISNTEAYVETHLEEYEQRCMSLENDSAEDLQWLGMVNCLLRNGYVGEFDSNMAISDFGWELKSLRGYKNYNLSLDNKFTNEDYGIDSYNSYDLDEDDEIYNYEETDLVENEDIESWCKYLNNKWADEGICLAMIDISTDSYIIFPIEEEILDLLEELADSINRHITIVY